MSLTKDGFYKSFSGAIGNNNYLLEAEGGHIAWGNGSNQIPYSNGTVNTHLNADMTDGLHVHGGRNNEANKLVRTDGSGYIQAGWINTTSGDMGSTAFSRIYVSNDAFIRYVSIARFKTVLFGGQVGSPSVPIYWTGSAFATCIVSFGNSSYGEHNANNINDNGIKYYNSNGPSTSLGATTSDGALYSQAYNTSWVAQIAQDYRNGGLYVRGKNNGTWQSWYRVWDNRTTYVSGGKGYIGSTEITQVNNADKLDGIHANGLFTNFSNYHSGTTHQLSISIGGTTRRTTPEFLAPYNVLTYGNSGLQYFNINGTAGTTPNTNVTPTSAWYHILRMNHANSAGYFFDIAAPLNDIVGIWWRQVRNGTNYGWYKIWDSNNSALSAKGTVNRIAWYNSATSITSGSVTTDGSYLGSVSYLSINNAHQTSYRFYVNGTSWLGGTTYQRGVIYLASGTTYFIDNSAIGYLNDLRVDQTRLADNWIGFYQSNNAGGNRYGYIQADGSYMYFRKENGNNGFNFNGNLVPSSNNAYTIGTSSLRWSNVFGVLGNYSGQVTVSVANGTAPFAITSTTKVNNLNVDLLDGWRQSNLVWSGYVTSGTASLSSYWFKAWTGTITSYQYNDLDFILLVSSAFNTKRGTIHIRIRQNGANNRGAYNFTKGLWLVNGNIPLADVRLYCNNSNGVCELWMNVVGQYGVYNYTVIKKTWRTGVDITSFGTLTASNFTTAQSVPALSDQCIQLSVSPLVGYYWANLGIQSGSSTTTTPQFGKVMINTTSTSYNLNVGGDSYVTGWSRASSGFYIENTGVHYTRNNSSTAQGELDLTSGNEYMVATSNGGMHINYRAVSRGTVVNRWYWRAGSSSSWAKHDTGTLRIHAIEGSYSEGIRIYPTGSWATIILGGNDLTADTGTSANSWSIHNNNSNFYINKNNSSAATANRLWARSGGGFTFGNTGNSSYVIESAGDIRTASGWFRSIGAYGWYNDTYGGGIWMNDSTYVRVYNSKRFWTDATGHFTSSSESASPGNAAIEIRERSRGTTGITHNYANAPRIGFHWGNRYWANLTYFDNSFRFMNDSCSGYITILSSGFRHSSVDSNSYVLLAGGGYKALSDFLLKPSYWANIQVSTSSNTWTEPTLGRIYVQPHQGSWVSGMTTNPSIWYNNSNAIDASSYWAFLGMKSSSSHVINFGGLGNNIGFLGYYAGRTANSYDWYFWCNTANGQWTASARLNAPGFYHTSYGSATYLLRSDGGVAAFNWSGQSGQPSWLWGGNSQHSYYLYNPSNFSVNYANYAGYAHKLDIYGYNTDGLSFNQTSSSFQGSDSGWAHYIIANHGNGSTYYNYILRLPFWGPPQYARKENGTNTSWYTFFTTENGYWADQRLQTSSNAYTVPSFAAIKIRNSSPAYHSADNIISGTAGEIYFAGNFHIDSRGSNKLYLNHYTSNSIAMVTGGGNVGIGTDSPSYGLTLAVNKRLYIEGNESNPIYTEYHPNSHISTNSPESNAAIRHGFVFKWYNTYWKIGNVRGGGTNSAGFGIAYSGGAQLQLLVRPSSKTWIYYGIHTFTSSQSWGNNPESGNNGISIKSINGGGVMTPYIHFVPNNISKAWRFATYYTGSGYGYENNLILYQGYTSQSYTTLAEYIFRGQSYGSQGKCYVATCEGNSYNLVVIGVFTLTRSSPSNSSYSVYQVHGLITPVIVNQVRNEWLGSHHTSDGGMIIRMDMRSGYENYTTKTTINIVSAYGIITETWWDGHRYVGLSRDDVDAHYGSLGSFDIAIFASQPSQFTTNDYRYSQTNGVNTTGRYLMITNRTIAGWNSNGGIGRMSFAGLYVNSDGACITFKVTCFGYLS